MESEWTFCSECGEGFDALDTGQTLCRDCWADSICGDDEDSDFDAGDD